MKIIVGSDHAGYDLKKELIPFLKELGNNVIDIGNSSSTELVYFPEIVKKVCLTFLKENADRAILFCGTGVGAVIAANKIPGIRAAVLHDWQSAHQAVEHDHVNVMCLGGKIVGTWLAEDLIKAFLNARGFTDDRTKHVLKLLSEMDAGKSID